MASHSQQTVRKGMKSRQRGLKPKYKSRKPQHSAQRRPKLRSPTSTSEVSNISASNTRDYHFGQQQEVDSMLYENENGPSQRHPVHSRLCEIAYDDTDDLADSQELMPPPSLLVREESSPRRSSRSKTRDEGEEEEAEGHRVKKRRSTRSSSRSTVILSDEENDVRRERASNYLKRSPSKQLKRSDDFNNSIPSNASSRSTVILSSPESL